MGTTWYERIQDIVSKMSKAEDKLAKRRALDAEVVREKSRSASERKASIEVGRETLKQPTSPALSKENRNLAGVLGCSSLVVIVILIVGVVNWLINDAPSFSVSHPSVATWIFFTTTVIYFSWSRKVGSWVTIREMGMEIGCPMGFLKNENNYHLVSCGLFILSAYIGIYSGLPFMISAIVLGSAWLMAGKFGHADACKNYREMLKTLLEVVHDKKERADIIGQLSMTDKELRTRQLRNAGFKV